MKPNVSASSMSTLREDSMVEPAILIRLVMAAPDRERIAEAGSALGDVGEGKGLPAEEEGANVVPTGEVLGRNA